MAHINRRTRIASLREPVLDARYDPYGMSLSLGPAADVDDKPDWEMSVDFERGVFAITVQSGDESAALEQLTRLYPRANPRVTHAGDRGRRRNFTGTLSPA